MVQKSRQPAVRIANCWIERWAVPKWTSSSVIPAWKRKAWGPKFKGPNSLGIDESTSISAFRLSSRSSSIFSSDSSCGNTVKGKYCIYFLWCFWGKSHTFAIVTRYENRFRFGPPNSCEISGQRTIDVVQFEVALEILAERWRWGNRLAPGNGSFPPDGWCVWKMPN